MCCSQQVACYTAGVRSSASTTFFFYFKIIRHNWRWLPHWPSLNSLTDGRTHGTKCLAITLPHCHIRRTLISGLLNAMISKKWRLSLVRRVFAVLSASNLVLSVRKKRDTLHWWPACGWRSMLKKVLSHRKCIGAGCCMSTRSQRFQLASSCQFRCLYFAVVCMPIRWLSPRLLLTVCKRPLSIFLARDKLLSSLVSV